MASNLPLLLLVLCSLDVAQCGLRVYNVYARGLRPNKTSNADGFVKMTCGSASRTTNVYHDSPNPSWSEELSYSRALAGDRLELKVYDKDVAVDDVLGVCKTSIWKGTYNKYCSLATGGKLYFSYRLS